MFLFKKKRKNNNELVMNFISKKLGYEKLDDSFKTNLMMKYPDFSDVEFSYYDNHFTDKGRTIRYATGLIENDEIAVDPKHVLNIVKDALKKSDVEIFAETYYNYAELRIDVSKCKNEKELSMRLGLLISEINAVCEYFFEYVIDKSSETKENGEFEEENFEELDKLLDEIMTMDDFETEDDSKKEETANETEEKTILSFEDFLKEREKNKKLNNFEFEKKEEFRKRMSASGFSDEDEFDEDEFDEDEVIDDGTDDGFNGNDVLEQADTLRNRLYEKTELLEIKMDLLDQNENIDFDTDTFNLVLEKYEINELVATHVISKYTDLSGEKIKQTLNNMPCVLVEDLKIEDASMLRRKLEKGKVFTKVVLNERSK